jgi:universal stress protein A
LPSTTLVGIPGPIAVSGADFPAAEKNLRTLAQSTRNGLGERTECKIRTGVPSHEIVEAAKEADVDLIVIATHGYTGWKHFCIGSTAERVVRAAPCPVLTVREKEHEFC